MSFAHEDHPEGAATQALVAALQTTRSWQRVATATFAIRGLTPAMSTWMGLQLSQDLLPYVSRLIHDPVLARAVPGLTAPELRRAGALQPRFERLHPLVLAGSVAAVMSTDGGAYDDGPSMAEAFAITQAWIAELFGSRYEDLRIAHTEGAWSNWFYDIFPSWDQTWLVTDVVQRQATLVCITDTD